jgi:PBSX family phage terminase large subunit
MNALKVSDTFKLTYDAYHRPNIRQLVSMGGSRSSKSYSILQLLMLELMKRRNIKITCWRNTKVTCRATIMEDFKNIIMFDPIVFKKFKENKQSGTFTYIPTGSRIIFEGADDIGKVLGSQQDISFFNEVTEFSKEVYLQITQRTSGKVICDYNPSKDFWLESYRFDEETTFIRTTFLNNSFCPPNIVKQLLSYEPWETGTYEVIDAEVFYKGKPITLQNQPPPHAKNVKKKTASVYLWMVYGLGLGSEKPNRIYNGWRKITQAQFDVLSYPSYFGLDFGTARPTANIEVKYDGNGGLYICKRLYKPLGEIEDSLTTVLKLNVPQLVKGKHYVVCDPAKSAYLDILRDAGYLAIEAIKGAGSIEAGISILKSLTIYYVPSEELEMEYTTYSWAVDKNNVSTDVPLKVNDHLMDALRYVASFLYQFLNIKV